MLSQASELSGEDLKDYLRAVVGSAFSPLETKAYWEHGRLFLELERYGTAFWSLPDLKDNLDREIESIRRDLWRRGVQLAPWQLH